MDITYAYQKKRSNFGIQPLFTETPAQMLDSIYPDVNLQKEYMLRNPVQQAVQASASQSLHEINSEPIVLKAQGMDHKEGAWPKDISPIDEEATTRYRRRVERDDTYISAILDMAPKLVKYIKQNNAVDMYQKYFKGMPPEEPVEKSFAVINNLFRDPELVKRPVSSISWTIEDDSKLVIAYCDKRYPINHAHNSVFSCYLWNIENPNDTLQTLLPPSACWQLDCSPVNPSLIVGGLGDGRVCVFDIRTQSEPVSVSPVHLAHLDPVTGILFMHSRLNTEFFSSATDGKCMWWDIRNLSVPSDMMFISVKSLQGKEASLASADGVTALQFDRAVPTRFLCGTDTGLVINVNRKGKTASDIMSSVYKAHNGPVKAVHRSPLSSKVFITCGGWSVHIWSDEVRSSPIITGTAQRYQINDVVWAPQKVSSYMAISDDGTFRYWDLLRKYREPLLIFPVSKRPLLKLKVQEEGRLVAIGDDKGETCLISLSDNLVIPGNKDKSLMLQNFDRETHREHILENRVKEIRLKFKAEEEEALAPPPEEVDEESSLVRIEEEYKKSVSHEMTLAGVIPESASRTKKERKRLR